MHKSAAEGATLKLTCPAPEKVRAVKVRYGHTYRGYCQGEIVDEEGALFA